MLRSNGGLFVRAPVYIVCASSPEAKWRNPALAPLDSSPIAGRTESTSAVGLASRASPTNKAGYTHPASRAIAAVTKVIRNAVPRVMTTLIAAHLRDLVSL